MKTKKSFWLPAVVLILGSFFFTPQSSLAVQGNTINIPSSAFVPDGGLSMNSYNRNFDYGYLEYTGGTGLGKFVAPVNFPKGCVTVDKVFVYVHDGNSAGIAMFDFWRRSLSVGGGAAEWLGGATSTDSTGIAKVSISVDPAKNTISSGYCYYLTVGMPHSVGVYGARVKYTAP